MMNAQLFCEECGAANSGELPYCHACHKPLTKPSANASTQDTTAATFKQIPVGNGKFAYALADPEEQTYHVGPLPKGYILNKRYKIIEQIGQGGFGIVYKARDRKRFNRLVAVKQINLDSLSPRDIIGATDSYNREISLQTPLRNPHIPRVYQHFKDPKHWYIIMKYVKGETLEDYLKHVPGGKLPEHEVIRIGMQLCRILEYLHIQQGIVFRDVKPANIMRTRRGKLYLIDFGIARRYVKNKAKDTVPLGSPGYAAPEQYGLAQTSDQSDIFGLGATLLTLLTGTDLSDDSTIPSVPQRPSKLDPLLNSMLEREVYKRPARVEDVYTRLLLLSNNVWGKFWYRARPASVGILVGCIPFILFGGSYLNSSTGIADDITGLFCLGPFILAGLFLTGIFFLFHQKYRLIGAYMMGTMLLLTIATIVVSSIGLFK